MIACHRRQKSPEVEGPENKDHKDSRGTIIRWLCYVFVTTFSSLCIWFCKGKPKTLRHNRFVTALIIIIDILCWILNGILASAGIPLIPYIPWWIEEDEIHVVSSDPHVDPPTPTVDPPTPTVDTPNGIAVTPQRSPIYDWLRLPRKATACPVCKGTAADFYVPNHCSHCGIGSSRVNCSAAQVLERSGFPHT